MRQLMVRRAQRRLVRHLRSTRTQVQVLAELGLFNFRCYENCVEYLRTHPDRDLEVVETIYIDEEEPCLHYVIRDKASGELLEVTLGWRARQLEYYVTRTLLPGDLDNIHREFTRSLAHWLDDFVPWWARVLLRVDRVL